LINSALVRNSDRIPGVNLSTFAVVQLRINFVIHVAVLPGNLVEKANAPSDFTKDRAPMPIIPGAANGWAWLTTT
jgi:hypothetical protein